MFTPLKLPVAAALLALASPPVVANAEEFRSAYTTSYMGIPLARSEFTSRFEGDRFTIEGTMKSSGIASIFDETRGGMSVRGRVTPGGVEADEFRVEYTKDGKPRMTAIRFEDGRVASTENVPPLRKRKKNWVPIEAEHLEAVADPLSATIVRAPDLSEVCRQTIRVYDGEMRADIRLEPVGEGEWNDQPTATCRARFVPVAGYRKTKKAIKFLAEKSRITLDFAPLGRTGLYAPVKASIGTEIGTVSVEAETVAPTD